MSELSNTTTAADDLFEMPLHPYTEILLSAVPSIDLDHPKKRINQMGRTGREDFRS